ncbi:hypothetical protein DSO57_1000880 [Entomophthora muscae]|uniref:Uncharacterized protein n=1 Tax=Entomophthora muscae TaxID=34485 RepID=A0ACC2SY17_9FUNG|nr:hypothetical protein DSO57_1000880 [Entomophthora muscae]
MLVLDPLALTKGLIGFNCEGLWQVKEPQPFGLSIIPLLFTKPIWDCPLHQSPCTHLHVKIDNSSPLETQVQEWDSNPDPGSPGLPSLWTAGLPARLCFFGIEPLQAEALAKPQSQNTSTSSTMVVPKEEPLKFPNGSRDDAYVNFMSLKPSQVTNQELTQERGTGLWPDPMTTTLEQDNQVAKSRFLTNEITPRQSAILLPLDLSTQCPDEPSMENVKFGGGVLYRLKDPALQTYCHF